MQKYNGVMVAALKKKKKGVDYEVKKSLELLILYVEF